jgi:putative transposase
MIGRFLAWRLERAIELVHIEPGKPVQNAHVKSFHGRLREECLNASWFGNLFDARKKIGAWRKRLPISVAPHFFLTFSLTCE